MLPDGGVVLAWCLTPTWPAARVAGDSDQGCRPTILYLMARKVIVEASGVTDRSETLWRSTKSMLGTIVEAIAWDIAAERTFSFDQTGTAPGDGSAGEGQSWHLGLMLRNSTGDELWLTGCRAGYSGAGVHAAERILLEAGFPPTLTNIVTRCTKLHLRIGQPEPVDVWYADSGESLSLQSGQSPPGQSIRRPPKRSPVGKLTSEPPAAPTSVPNPVLGRHQDSGPDHTDGKESGTQELIDAAHAEQEGASPTALLRALRFQAEAARDSGRPLSPDEVLRILGGGT